MPVDPCPEQETGDPLKAQLEKLVDEERALLAHHQGERRRHEAACGTILAGLLDARRRLHEIEARGPAAS
ncbi:hypothetical protein LAZ40_09620 [Cereibacter sphaeroides]|uniref:hypothetical protein n=1 Tax=Cereibacter sphaeroides TaxID=1063 RepID=UPI001F254285|nr:hypothetical protein [Cereibacter sphaeroides]MCE6959308.1 hypothetical protein [Cereibacter sphaeroides]MCE6972900.1 hypothetical protein [Cereibacter sphaeroides]